VLDPVAHSAWWTSVRLGAKAAAAIQRSVRGQRRARRYALALWDEA